MSCKRRHGTFAFTIFGRIFTSSSLQWTPEARRILTGSTSGEFTLWNGLTFNFETILQAHDTAICTFEFCHSGHYLASADKTGVIKYFEPNMNNLNSWQGSNSREAIRGLSFSPDDRRFATASDDSSVRIWSFHESRIESVLTGASRYFNIVAMILSYFVRSRLGRQMRAMAPHEGSDCVG